LAVVQMKRHIGICYLCIFQDWRKFWNCKRYRQKDSEQWCFFWCQKAKH